ncbi:ABC transporter ATP-binding protein [Ignatzschineria cameli]|uniref:ABC transporter ATP-binding protein n=1 Tax=Ignatzschineria cameli TaxID=2182793 RepID=A0ABX5KXP9_9GAMM|nr:ABC transporter ATP-binding protein [Ignatzschineria cameli]PWD88518.1 ABC transporter ATP-binding protein [Ignatzschineria cameli]PWD89113.1 ABC transporter ATP-binding protein [Ignatzschineria cameli]PWD89961.1 ABC transporter ATP-binding protein [Ignatzschineria cameli]
MIKIENLTKSYLHHKAGRKYVFKDLSFTIPSDKNVAIIGKNGAGKSTLMNLLAKVDSPDSGRIITDKSISWPVGLSGGFQGSLSARENVKFIARTQGFRGKELYEKVAYVEQFAEIGDYFDLPTKTYSSGMRGRVAFGLSLAFDFDYYIVDEAMSVGDAHFKRKASKAFKDKVGKANIILVTHGMTQVRTMCDLVIILNDGKAKIYEDVEKGIEVYQQL